MARDCNRGWRIATAEVQRRLGRVRKGTAANRARHIALIGVHIRRGDFLLAEKTGYLVVTPDYVGQAKQELTR